METIVIIVVLHLHFWCPKQTTTPTPKTFFQVKVTHFYGVIYLAVSKISPIRHLTQKRRKKVSNQKKIRGDKKTKRQREHFSAWSVSIGKIDCDTRVLMGVNKLFLTVEFNFLAQKEE